MLWDREVFQLLERAGGYFGIGPTIGWLTLIGGGYFLESFALLLLSSGYLLRVEHLKHAGWLSAYAIGLSGSIAFCLKILFGRARPSLGLSPWAFIGPTFFYRYQSFPSGHATITFALAATLSRLWPRARWPFFLGAGVIALSRVLTGSHFPSDVFGGALLGIFVSGVVGKGASSGAIRAYRPIAWILAKRERALEKMHKVATRLFRRPVVGWCFISIVPLYLNRARDHPLKSGEVIVDLLGAATVVVGWGLRVWAKGRFPSKEGGMDLTGVGSLTMILGFGIMLQSWWVFIILCGAVAFSKAFTKGTSHQGGESQGEGSGFRDFFWEEAKLLGLCLLAILMIELSEYLYRLYVFR